MQELEKEKEAELLKEKKLPNFGPGSVLELTLVILLCFPANGLLS